MNGTQRKRLFIATLFAAAFLTAGCAADDKPPPPMPDLGQPLPKLVRNLNDVAATPVDPLAIDRVPARGDATSHDRDAVTAAASASEGNPGIKREVGSDRNPATVRLLNDKAAQFGNFSAVILDRIYAQLIIAERSEEIARTKLPTDIKAVIITAIMDKSGKLTELILEQHSGKSRIDQMMIAVCKKSIWYENPPASALSSDGTYKLTIKMKLENFASLDEHHWSFSTDLGLGLG